MPDLALWDLVAPYFLLGNKLQNIHAALSVLGVESYRQAEDPSGAVLRGVARFHGTVEPWFDPTSLSFGVNAAHTEGHPIDDPSRRDPWIDFRDTTVEFSLLAPRVGSAIIAAGHGPIDNPAPVGFAQTDAVIDAIDALPVDAPFSDYPSSAFVLDLVITSAVLRPPFLRAARLRADGALELDPTKTNVKLTLPKIKLRISQGSAVGAPATIDLLSLGSSGLDEPGDLGVANLVTMDPPYAFIGPGQVVGFGFRSAVLDLSEASTPPAVLEQFGFDPSWTGVYFPEIRIFIAPKGGGQGWAVDAGVRNLLIGIGRHAGITGDFELDVINQGAGPLTLGARFSGPNGTSIGITRTGDHAEAIVPAQTTMVVDVSGRRPPYITEISTDGGTTFVIDRIASLDLSGTPELTVVVRATAQGDTSPTSLTIRVRRRDTSGSSGTPPSTGAVPDARVTASSSVRAGQAVDEPRLEIANDLRDRVVVRLSNGAAATWTVDGAAQGAATATITVNLGPSQTRQVVATVPGTSTKAPIYFHFDEPDAVANPSAFDTYAANEDMTRTAESVDDTIEHGWTGGTRIRASSEHKAAMEAIPAGTTITVVGHASWESNACPATDPNCRAGYNRLLSERRAMVARSIYDELAPAANVTFLIDGRGFTEAKPAQLADPAANPRRRWWRAELRDPITIGGVVTTGTVERGPVAATPPVPTTPPDPPPATPARPDFLRSLGAKVRIIRDQFIAVELHGEIDVDTAAEQTMRTRVPSPSDVPTFQGLGHQNPGDGIVAFRGVFTVNPGSDEWQVVVLFGSDPSDVDGLLATGSLPGQALAPRSVGRDVLGLYTLFFPLIAEVAPEQPGQAGVGELVLSTAAAGLPLLLAGTGWFIVERVVWYGAEIVVHQHAGEWSTAILLDLETAVSADIRLGGLRLLTIARDKPLVARYKAIGVRFGQAVDRSLILHPVFDSSKGYTLDIGRPGSLTVADPLGQVLKVIGARVSRTNPMMFEIELGSAVDLGVVSLERVGVRIRLDGSPISVELTSLGVRVDIPGALAGSGYLAISESGMAGRIDLTIVPVRLRVMAALAIRNIPAEDGGPATAVAVALEVEFPVAIPLWSSGLGIYGLIGLFAMHFTRNEELDAASTTKALSWLRRANGDPTHVEDETLWRAEIDHWAFGVGATVGTMGSPIVFNMKGVFLLELPGPRLLLMMKANVLFPMPEAKGNAEGTLLAVIDLDAARETLTIGIVIDFSVTPLLSIRIPVEAFFNGRDTDDWHLYLGSYQDPVRVTVLMVFEGSGYVMIFGGGGSPAPVLHPDLPRPAGFGISAGIHVSMFWGVRAARLYAELSAGFDAVLGFSPLLIAGRIEARGELMLFIASLSARAQLDVRLGEVPGSNPVVNGYLVEGEVCGSIDLFFFDIEACIDFRLEDNSPPDITIPDLLAGVSLVSRSPALVHGTAADQAVDAAIGDAIRSATEPNWATLPDDQQAAGRVPIDAIPAVMFSAPPMVAGGVTFLGSPLGGASGGREIERSNDRVTYTLEAVDLVGTVVGTNKPASWWTLLPPTEANQAAQLALLSWVPTAVSKALQRSEEQIEAVRDRWGTVCYDAAPPASVLWTFRFEPLGPSVQGWDVDGEPWPDPPQTVRSQPVSTNLRVTERWRCGDPMVDAFRGIYPAEVVGALVGCPWDRDPRRPDLRLSDVRLFRTAGRAATGAGEIETIDEPSISMVDLRQRLELGLPASRAALSTVHQAPDLIESRSAIRDGGLVTTPARPPTRMDLEAISMVGPQGKCATRLLASPQLDRLEPARSNDARRIADIKDRWQQLGFDPGDLTNGVILRPGTFEEARLLLFVQRPLLGGALVLRVMDETGAIIDERRPDSTDICSWASLPSTWTDPNSPWDDDVSLVMQHLNALPQRVHVPILVHLKGASAADRILIGIVPDAHEEKLPGPPYYVAALEALTTAEIGRSDFDSHTVIRDRDVLEAALAADSGEVALLVPNTTYRVNVNWSASAYNTSDPSSVVPQPNTQVSFWFRTAAAPPDRLDGWILATMPYDGERNVFGNEPLQIAFATNDVLRLFDAYDQRLEIRIWAASANHPEPDSDGVPSPFGLDTTSVVPVAAAILSPWELAVVELVDGTCVPVDGNRERHTVTSIPIPLEPRTDYLLDVERVDKTAAAGTRGTRIFRRSFSTSLFPTLADFAAYFQGARVVSRAVPTGLTAAVAAAFASRQPEGEELDVILRGTATQPGIEPLPVPDRPRIWVWWEGGGTPSPTAIIVDSTEPLWRDRERAKLVTMTGTNVEHYELSRDEWVAPVEAAGSDSVARIVRAPGGQRAIVILKPGSRGKTVKLALRRRAFTESYLDGASATDQVESLVDVGLARAPWEED